MPVITSGKVLPADDCSSSEGESDPSLKALIQSPASRSRFTKRTVGAAVGAGLLVAAAVLIRRHAGLTTVQDHGVEMKDTMKVRVAFEKCTARGADCTQTQCCSGTNEYCWRTDTGGAVCQEKSKPGWPGEELEGPSTVVPVDPSQQGSSLFCFTVYRKNKGTSDADDEALRLLQGQKGCATGIFACDMWRVYSDVDGKLDEKDSLIKISEEPGDSFYQTRRPEAGGWGGNQWINTPLFRMVWKKIYSEFPGGFNQAHWVVKADPDTVFLPARLSARLESQEVPVPGLYIEHCKSVDFGFFGSLEVMSKKAALTLFQHADDCYKTELSWKTDKIATKYGWYGEDLFAQRCMDLHGVNKIWQFELVADGTCPKGRPWGLEEEKKWVPDEVTCEERDTFVAFKPLKRPADFAKCLSAVGVTCEI